MRGCRRLALGAMLLAGVACGSESPAPASDEDVGWSGGPTGDVGGGGHPGSDTGGGVEDAKGLTDAPEAADTGSGQGDGGGGGGEPDGDTHSDGGGADGGGDGGGGEGGSACGDAGSPGAKGMARLNRAEYDNTIRDLIGLPLALSEDFPADDHSFGFDNIADALTTSPNLVGKLAAAASHVVEEALWLEVFEPLDIVGQAELIDEGCGVQGEYAVYCTNDEVALIVDVALAGDYMFTTLVAGHQAGPDPVQVVISVDGGAVLTVSTAAVVGAPELISVAMALEPGIHAIAVAFVNDYWNPSSPDPAQKDRNLLVDYLRLQGPAELPVGEQSPVRDEILVCVPTEGEDPHSCAEQILGPFAAKAWRRPLEPEELSRLVALVDVALEEEENFEQGIRLALEAILLSPHFLYRPEGAPPSLEAAPYVLNDWELAARLSYFLWSSMPDAELAGLADAGLLANEAELEEQVDRMLLDPRAYALVENFAGQWLYTRGIEDIFKDSVTYPEFDPELAQSMRSEAELVFAEIAFGDSSMLDLVDSGFTYVDERLAALYGLDAPGEPGFVRVELPDDRRGGVLGQGSLLAVTSHPARTSPVRRGKWILGQLLCAEPEPPPNDIPPLPEEQATGGDLKEIMALHSADPKCAPCHKLMDPLGFALENYDAIGAWRTSYPNGESVDPISALPDGTVVDSPASLRALLRSQPAVARCMAEKLGTYALGRGIASSSADACHVDAWVARFEAGGHRFSDLVKAIVSSKPFRERAASPAPAGSVNEEVAP